MSLISLLREYCVITPVTDLICPLDHQPLQRQDGTWRCANGHSFDIAKQGYVNLLAVQNKRSKDPGDSKAMIQARQRFLAQGFYQPLAEQVASVILASDALSVLDAGCGEGYYVRQLIQTAEQQAKSLQIAGLDISKWAVQQAAKQEKRATWMVASNSALPLADNSVDTLMCLFGFPAEAEFERVLKPEGRLIMVDPASNHLHELKQIIYPEIKDKPAQLPINDNRWTMLEEKRVSYSVTLPDNDTIRDLLTMTPHLYRSSYAGRERAEALKELDMSVDVWVRAFGLK